MRYGHIGFATARPSDRAAAANGTCNQWMPIGLRLRGSVPFMMRT